MNPPEDLSLSDFIRALPKTETHLHIEGALPYQLLHAWQPEKYPDKPLFRTPAFRFSSFPDFDQTLLAHALPWFVSAERYHVAAKAVFEQHVEHNVKYVETSFHLPVTGFIGVPGREIVAAIRAAVPAGLEVRIFAGMLRTDYAATLQAVIDELESWEDLAGVDLHGFEKVPTEPWTSRVWSRLRQAGKITKVHAGEFDGAARVREAIEVLGSDRIQHGVRAVEDPDVVRLAADRGVTFDMCPISNVKLQVVSSMREHPIRDLMRAGVRCTISTDDPLVFANTLTDEYTALADELGFSAADLAAVARSGFEVALLPAAEKQRWIGAIDRLAGRA